MGEEAIFKCNKCKTEFDSSSGDSKASALYRCVKCDEIKFFELKSIDDRRPIEEIGKCHNCGNELKHGLGPMCPKCRSRDVSVKEVLAYYD